MWSPDSDNDDKLILDSLRPVETLYFYDEPLLFTAKTKASFPVLCYKIDEEDGISQYVVTQTSPTLVAKIKDGQISLRSALQQPWCWITTCSEDYVVTRAVGMSGQEIPGSLLPDSGIGLAHEHGIIADAKALADRAPFLSIKFNSEAFKSGTIPIGTFKNILSEVYDSIGQLFLPIIGGMAASLTEARRVLQFPIRPPAIASLLLEIEEPTLDAAAMKEPRRLDVNQAMTRLAQAKNVFFSQATEIVQAADDGQITGDLAKTYFSALEIITRIAPRGDDAYDSVTIAGRTEEAQQTIVIDAREGQIIHNAYAHAKRAPRRFAGAVVEINARSNTFIVRTDEFREVTCELSTSRLREALPEIRNGMRVIVDGTFQQRTRRDYLIVNTLEYGDRTLSRYVTLSDLFGE